MNFERNFMEEKKYFGIKSKEMKNGDTHIFVRLKYKGEQDSSRNYTKLFGCKTKEDAYLKIEVVKDMIDRGQDPFKQSKNILNDLWFDYSQHKLNSGEWKESTYASYTFHYDRWVREKIGWMKIALITTQMIQDIIKSMSHLSVSSQRFINDMLYQVFQDAMTSKKILQSNVVYDVKLPKDKKEKRKISHISDDTSLEIVRKIYKTIPNYEPTMKKHTTEEIRAIFYMLLLTAHRVKEVASLESTMINFDKKIITAPPHITKTRETYIFPLPEEVLEYFKSKKGMLFPNINVRTLLKRWYELVNMAGIHLKHNQRMNIHDTRRLMFSVMTEDCYIQILQADACLNHKAQGMLKFYADFEKYSNIEKSYFKYWEAVRGGVVEQPQEQEITLEDIPKEILEMVKMKKQMEKINES